MWTKETSDVNALSSFIELYPVLSVLGMTIVIVILRLLGIGKKLITLGAIIAIAGGSIYLAKTMG